MSGCECQVAIFATDSIHNGNRARMQDDMIYIR